MNQDLARYYAERAREYEDIYRKPERQPNLAAAAAWLQEELAGCTVLEVACGTGFWTAALSASARRLHACDLNPAVLELALSKSYPRGNVTFTLADLRALPFAGRQFDAVFGGFIWSHIPLPQLDAFLAALRRPLRPQGKIVLIDNVHVAGSSHPIAQRDALGNTYQIRALQDGSQHLVLKNFPTAEFLQEKFHRQALRLKLNWLDYYWMLTAEAEA